LWNILFDGHVRQSVEKVELQVKQFPWQEIQILEELL
jgi:hypothetical protein